MSFFKEGVVLLKVWSRRISLCLFAGGLLCCINSCNDGPHTLEREPCHLAGAMKYSNEGYFESSSDPRFIHFNSYQNILSDDRTETLIDGDDLIRCADDCTPEVLRREKLFIVVEYCDRVFVVAHDFSIRTFMTLDKYQADGDEILEGVRRDIPLHICQMLRYRLGMGFDETVESRWIFHDRNNWSVIDSHSGFAISDQALVSLGKRCNPRLQCSVDRGIVVALCNVFFVIDKDWVVLEISYENPCPPKEAPSSAKTPSAVPQEPESPNKPPKSPK